MKCSGVKVRLTYIFTSNAAGSKNLTPGIWKQDGHTTWKLLLEQCISLDDIGLLSRMASAMRSGTQCQKLTDPSSAR